MDTQMLRYSGQSADDGVVNFWRLILIVFSALSFQPQLRLTWIQKDSRGISVYHLWFSLLSATEQLSVWFAITVNASLPEHGQNQDDVNPPNVGTWLSIAQLTVVWLLFLLRFFQCLYYPSHHKRWEKIMVSVILGLYLLITIVPVVDDYIGYAILYPPAPYRHGMSVALFAAGHLYVLNPFISLGVIVGIYLQFRQLSTNPTIKNLSLDGLAFQGALFAIISVSWHFELYQLVHDDSRTLWQALRKWLELTAWVVLNNAFYSFGQLLQLWKVSDQWTRIRDPEAVGETDPLLPVAAPDPS